MESYLMAFGLAVTMGEAEDEAHLFARNYEVPVTYPRVRDDYVDFVNRRNELNRCVHRNSVGVVNPKTGDNEYVEFKEFRDAKRTLDLLRNLGMEAWLSFKDCKCGK
jgi:hypothetical protein